MGGRKHDDDINPTDPAGRVSTRMWLYSTDKHGNRIRAPEPDQIGYTVMPVRPTPPHALSYPDDGGREEELYRRGHVARVVEELRRQLTPRQFAIMRYQRKLLVGVEDRRRIPAGDTARYIRGGYTYVPGSEETEEREGLPPIVTCVVVGRVEQEVEALNHELIAERLGCSVRAVRKDVQRANAVYRRILCAMGEK